MYKVGGFIMPTSGGTFHVETGFKPQGVMFMGGNQSAEDVLITPPNPGGFFGTTWHDYASGALDQQSLSPVWHGVSWTQKAIHCSGDSGTDTDYEAVMLSHDDTGFTLNVLVPADDHRPIHYLAYGDMEGAGGTTDFSTDNKQNHFALPYHPTTGLAYHMFISSTARELATNAGIYFSMGVSNWPENGPATYNSDAEAMTNYLHTQIPNVGLTLQDIQGYSYITKTIRPDAGGNYQHANDHLSPWPSPDSYGIQYGLFGYNTRHILNWFTGEGRANYVGDSPNLGVVHTYNSGINISEIEAVLFFGTTGYSTFQTQGPPCAYMWGVLGPDYQGCIGFDFGRHYQNPHDPAFFQSTQMCYCDNLFPDTGVRAASGELVGKNMLLTGQIADSLANGSGSMMQMYGEGSGASPGFFRVLHK